MLGGGEQGAIMIVPQRYDAATNRVAFVVAGYNRSGVPINFGPENISLALDTGTLLAIRDFDNLRTGYKRDADLKRMAAPSEALAAGYAEYQKRPGDPDRYDRAARVAGRTYDYRQYAIAENLTYTVHLARETVLQTTTIDPQSYWGGLVIAERPRLAPGEVRTMTVTVSFAGEIHRFNVFLAAEGTPTPPQVSLPAVTLVDGVGTLYQTPPTWLWDVAMPAVQKQPQMTCISLRNVNVCGDPNSRYR